MVKTDFVSILTTKWGFLFRWHDCLEENLPSNFFDKKIRSQFLVGNIVLMNWVY